VTRWVSGLTRMLSKYFEWIFITARVSFQQKYQTRS
jgi:hypothetical protein